MPRYLKGPGLRRVPRRLEPAGRDIGGIDDDGELYSWEQIEFDARGVMDFYDALPPYKRDFLKEN
jgi:hypothetical protein